MNSKTSHVYTKSSINTYIIASDLHFLLRGTVTQLRRSLVEGENTIDVRCHKSKKIPHTTFKMVSRRFASAINGVLVPISWLSSLLLLALSSVHYMIVDILVKKCLLCTC